MTNDDLKITDIYNLMFNEIMYEVAYQKLRSNPGNMTPGIGSYYFRCFHTRICQNYTRSDEG